MTDQKLAVLVARVSTRRQAREGLSLETQLEKCREYAKQNGFRVIVELQDVISGTVPIADRPAGRELYRLIEARRIGVVIFCTNDRTARDDFSIEYLLLKDRCYSNGIELHFANSGLDDNSPMGNIFGYIRQQIAAEERRKITERTMRNKIAKAERGKWVGSGATRYGYKRIGVGKDGKLIIDEHEASLVRKIFEWYQKGQSIRGVVRQVNAQGAVTKRGKKWQLSTVQEVLTSAEYVGYFHFCGITTHFPALKIIDKRVFDDVQIRLQSNKDLSRRNSKHDYLLSSVIKCANSHKMHGAADNKRQLFYYRCDGRLKCSCRYVRADVADALVWDWIVSTLDDDLIERGFQRMAQRRAEEIEPKCTRLAQVQKLLDSIDSKIARLVREMSDEDDDVLRAAVKAETKNLSRQHEGLSKDMESLQAQIEQSEISQETRERIRQTVREVRGRLHNATFAQKRFVINKLEVQLVSREDDAGRWLDVSWGIEESPDSVPFVKKILSIAA